MHYPPPNNDSLILVDKYWLPPHLGWQYLSIQYGLISFRNVFIHSTNDHHLAIAILFMIGNIC